MALSTIFLHYMASLVHSELTRLFLVPEDILVDSKDS